jgi:hypothetical protein
MGPLQKFVRGHDFIDDAPSLCRLSIKCLPGQNEITAARGADYFGPKKVHAIARDHAKFEMRFVLKNSLGCR